MDNGQHGQIPTNQELFADGITAGVGTASEKTNPLSPDNNLDSEDFESHNFGSRGNTTLNSSVEMPMPPSEITTPTPNFTESDSTNTGELGKIINIPTPPLKDLSPTNTDETQNPSVDTNDSATKRDIENRFGDGKVNKDDKTYLDSKVNELSPADLVDFRNEACAAMQNKLKGPK